MCGGAGVLPMDEKMMKRLSSCSGLNGWILLEGFDCEMFFMSQYILAARTLKRGGGKLCERVHTADNWYPFQQIG